MGAYKKNYAAYAFTQISCKNSHYSPPTLMEMKIAEL